jgi:hypothetical protein
MSGPRWSTLPGQLGIIPELDFYSLQLVASDLEGGDLEYSVTSGALPQGIRLIKTTGVLQGVPIAQAGQGSTAESRFTIRVKNVATLGVTDRTFALTITNVSPPVITPRNVDLGLFFVGTIVDEQLIAVNFDTDADLVWRVKSGQMPPGLTLSASGQLIGYLELILSSGPDGQDGWEETPWAFFGWDFFPGVISKNFEFTVEVFDGLYYDLSTYKIRVFPRSQLRADSTGITADANTIELSMGLTVDTGVKHDPVILTSADGLPISRQDTFFSFDINGLDFDFDVLNYQLYSPPVALTGGFDEQSIVGDSTPYVTEEPSGSYITEGVYPKVVTTIGANNITSTSISTSVPNYIEGDSVLVLQGDGLWYDATINTNFKMDITGTTILLANAGQIITQTISTGNATVLATAGPTIATIGFTGNLLNVETGDFITQVSSGANAQVIANSYATMSATTNYITSDFDIGSGNIAINGSPIDTYPTGLTTSTEVTAQYNSSALFLFGTSLQSTANANIGGTDSNSLISSVTALGVTLGSESTEGQFGFDETKFNQELLLAPGGAVTGRTTYVAVGSAGTTFKVTSTAGAEVGQLVSMDLNLGGGKTVVSVDDATTITLSSAPDAFPTDGDAVIFLQESAITIDLRSGWLTGQLPTQNVSEITYNFEVVVFKEDYPTYQTTQLYALTVLGDVVNNIEWVTDADLGTIQNGDISDLSLVAESSVGGAVYYSPTTDGGMQIMPQGLRLSLDGLLVGRVSFLAYNTDQGDTTFDAEDFGLDETTFDQVYRFTVTAHDISGSVSNERTFTIRVITRNAIPYENLYLSALLKESYRLEFLSLMTNSRVFSPELIYRANDPYFGLANNINTLFLPGLSPATAASYVTAANINHYTKRMLFGEIKTAVARDEDFNIKYEVVYIEVSDENTNSDGEGPIDVIDRTNAIIPHTAADGNQYTIAYPNAITNMNDRMIDQIGYENKGALPDWMTSTQADGRVLGFTRGAVLAYTLPEGSETVAFRLKELDFNFNEIDFSVDRYRLDNRLSENFDIALGEFVKSHEVTFDRYPATGAPFVDIGAVDYAVSSAFSDINKRTLAAVIEDEGGLDGVTDIRDGDTLVFAQQEFFTGQDDIGEYNQGWHKVITLWDFEEWDNDANTVTNSVVMTLTGKTFITANVGDNITQTLSSANANVITNVLLNNVSVSSGNLTFGGNLISANVGDFITQVSSGANANVQIQVALGTAAAVDFVSGTFDLGSGNISINGTPVATYPTDVVVNTNVTADYFDENLFIVGNPLPPANATINGTDTNASITSLTTISDLDDLGWDAATIVSGFVEHDVNSAVRDERISVWQLSMDDDKIISLTSIQEVEYLNVLFVRNGSTYGRSDIYYDPILKDGLTIPNYSIIPQSINVDATTFDMNGTKFYNNRDKYEDPGIGDKYIKYTKTTVFN